MLAWEIVSASTTENHDEVPILTPTPIDPDEQKLPYRTLFDRTLNERT